MLIRKSFEWKRNGSPWLLSFEEAAEHADIMPATLSEHIADGNGPDHYLIDGENMFTAGELNDWIEEMFAGEAEVEALPQPVQP